MSLPFNLQISSLHWPVTVLGYGKRVGIWFQGCTIGCQGCCAPDTWESDPKLFTTVDKVMSWVHSIDSDEIDGFTISGGEPFQQPEALFELLQQLALMKGNPAKRDVLVYSGFSFAALRRRYRALIELCDMVISDPYKEDSEAAHLRGSVNQTLNFLSPLAELRYSDAATLAPRNRLQVQYNGNDLTVIGIPQGKESHKLLVESLEEKGIFIRSLIAST